MGTLRPVEYFAYGSNMDPEEMARTCPGYGFVSVAVLRGYTLTFDTRTSDWRGCGVADVEPDPGGEVWGVIYRVPPPDLPALDRKEGYRPGRPHSESAYVRRAETVWLPDGPGEGESRVELYVVAMPAPSAPHPSSAYMGLLLRGARHWGLPGSYIKKLERVPTLD
ncbi:MAG: gamma-glutamylcyclotransferase [Candidatus Zixiibacteriota bacterium]